MPLYDFICESCGWEYDDVYLGTSEMNDEFYCSVMMRDVVHIDVDEETGEEVEIAIKKRGCVGGRSVESLETEVLESLEADEIPDNKLKEIFEERLEKLLDKHLRDEQPLIRKIGAPASMMRVNRVGEHGDPRTRKEESLQTRKRLLKRSYDHEFTKGGKGVDQRREVLDKLKKKKVPLAGHSGF